MEISYTTHQTYDPKKVDDICKIIQSEDPDWIYKVRHDPKGTGFSVIDVFDEDGIFVSMM